MKSNWRNMLENDMEKRSSYSLQDLIDEVVPGSAARH